MESAGLRPFELHADHGGAQLNWTESAPSARTYGAPGSQKLLELVRAMRPRPAGARFVSIGDDAFANIWSETGTYTITWLSMTSLEEFMERVGRIEDPWTELIASRRDAESGEVGLHVDGDGLRLSGDPEDVFLVRLESEGIVVAWESLDVGLSAIGAAGDNWEVALTAMAELAGSAEQNALRREVERWVHDTAA